MKKIFIIIVLCLFITRCETYYELSEHQGAIVKYKNVDSTAGWIEVGIREKNKTYLIYVPLEYDSVFQLNDTIK